MLAIEQQVARLKSQKFPVLSDGFVRYVDHMGSDERIVEAARLTSGVTGGDDRNLLRYLMRHLHTTPIEFCVLCLHVRVPMDCWRQWIRHRTASVNEFSTRYSEAIDEKDTTKAGAWRLQSKSNRQGSSKEFLDLADGEMLTSEEAKLHYESQRVYQHRLELGVAKEQARKDLPLSTYTEAYWQINLHNLFHFLFLRMDSHAQIEIRSYADIIGKEIVANIFPMAWEAFCNYRLNAVTLSSLDVEVLKEIFSVLPHCMDEKTFLDRFQHSSWREMKICRERDECIAKLNKLGFFI